MCSLHLVNIQGVLCIFKAQKILKLTQYYTISKNIDISTIMKSTRLAVKNFFSIRYLSIEILDKKKRCYNKQIASNKCIPPCERTFFKYRHESMTNIILFGLITNKAQKRFTTSIFPCSIEISRRKVFHEQRDTFDQDVIDVIQSDRLDDFNLNVLQFKIIYKI